MAGWVKVPEEWLDDPEIEQIPADVVLLHLTALAHTARHSTNGHIPTSAVRKLWPTVDLGDAIGQLVEASLWQPVATGWYIPEWETFVLSATEVERRRADGRQRTERWRRHKLGDHSLCDRCSAKRGDASRNTSGDSPPNRSAPTRRGGEEERTEAGSAGAPPARSVDPHPFLMDNEDLECPCHLPPENPAHDGRWLLGGHIRSGPHQADGICCPYDDNHPIHTREATA